MLDVFQSVLENHRKDDFKNRNLQKLPEERTLGIRWDIEIDLFKLKVELKKKPMTQRRKLSIVSSIYNPLGFVASFILRGTALPR